jgi:acid-sensing ion channel, other
MSITDLFQVYFHGAREIPEISKQVYTFPKTDYATVELLALEIFSSPESKELSCG